MVSNRKEPQKDYGSSWNLAWVIISMEDTTGEKAWKIAILPRKHVVLAVVEVWL
jgi:hypothetical protein